MSTSKRLTEVFKSAQEVPFDDSSKFIFFSDCHRGDNSWADDFAHNQSLFFHALKHYYDNAFTYIELGDGDELWENKHFSDIRRAHSDVFWLMQQFYENDRFYMIFGNHDIEKKYPKKASKMLNTYFDERSDSEKPLFDGIQVHEGLILKYSGTGQKIFVVHGHQGDLFSDQLWRVGRFFVRHVWRHLQLVAINDPTSPAKNFKKRNKVEQKIMRWVHENNQPTIIGHTHRPRFPDKASDPLLFNDGSCVHPRCITGLEIEDGEISLIKWSIRPNAAGALAVVRDILEGPKNLQTFGSTT